MSPVDILTIMKDYGGWGVATVAIYGLIRVYNDAQKKDALVFGFLTQNAHVLKEIRGTKPEPPQLTDGE